MAFFALFTVAMFVFWVKHLIVDAVRGKALLNKLAAREFKRVESAKCKKVKPHLMKYLKWKHTSRTSVTIKHLIVQRQGPDMVRFVGTLRTLTPSRGGKNQLGHYTTLIEITPTHVSGDIEIHLRLPEIYARILEPVSSSAEHTGRQVIQSGLDQAFLDKFMVTAKPEDALTLSANVQHALLEERFNFPLREPGYVTHVYITPSGWSITCQRVHKAAKLSALLTFADKLTASLAKARDTA